MHFSHSTFPTNLRKLHLWKWGITLDWNSHRWIFRIGSPNPLDNEDW